MNGREEGGREVREFMVAKSSSGDGAFFAGMNGGCSVKSCSRETADRPQLWPNRQSLPKRLNRHDRRIRYQFTWHPVLRDETCK